MLLRYKLKGFLTSPWGIALVLLVSAIAVYVALSLISGVRDYNASSGYRQPPEVLPDLARRAEQGDVEAARKLWIHYEETNDKDKSLYWLRKGAVFGDPRAQQGLYWFLKNATAPELRAEALANLTKAAQHGHPDAQETLARIYAKGDGVKKDLDAAENWLRRAATSRSPTAMEDLCALILEEHPTRERLVEAYAWASLAVQNAEDNSAVSIGSKKKMEKIKVEAQARKIPIVVLEKEAAKIKRDIMSSGKRP